MNNDTNQPSELTDVPVPTPVTPSTPVQPGAPQAPTPPPQPATFASADYTPQPELTTPAPNATYAPNPVVSSAAPPPKKSKKSLIVTLVLLGVVVLAGAGVATYLAFFQPEKTDNSVDSPASASETKEIAEKATDYASVLIKKIKTAQEELVSAHPTLTITDGTQTGIYRPSDTNYYISSTTSGYSLYSTTSDTQNDNSDLMANVAEMSISILDTDSSLTQSVIGKYTLYQSNDVACSVANYTSNVEVACSNSDINTSLASTTAPLVAALPNNGSNEGLYYFNPIVTETSDGYANAKLGIFSLTGFGGHQELFYKANGQWHDFTGTQETLSCSAYNSYALQKAFEGTECYDASSNLTALTVTLTNNE